MPDEQINTQLREIDAIFRLSANAVGAAPKRRRFLPAR